MEKRKYSRVVFHAEATVKTAGVAISGTVDNLSMKGMFLNTHSRAAMNEPAEITIHLFGTELSITLSGEIIRHTEDGMAIKFSEMDLDSFTHLKKIVSYNSENADRIEDEFYNSISFE